MRAYSNEQRRTYVALTLCFIICIIVVILPHGESKNIASVTFSQNEYVNRSAYYISATDEKYLYLYYDEYGIVNVYSRDGTFIYSILVGHITNGKGKIAIVDGLLYIKARGNIIYILDGQNVIDTIVYSYEKSIQGDTSYRDYEAKMNPSGKND